MEAMSSVAEQSPFRHMVPPAGYTAAGFPEFHPDACLINRISLPIRLVTPADQGKAILVATIYVFCDYS